MPPDPAPAPPPAEGALRFDRRARPHRAMRRWAFMLAIACSLFSGFLLPLLMAADHLSSWGLVGLLIGAGLGAVIIASVAGGTRLTIDGQGVLTYHLGDRPNLRVPLAAITQWGAVDCGVLKGIGADCPLEAIEILHRKGVRLSQLREQQQALGFALVFEFQDPTEIPRLEALARKAGEGK